jgi:hypothetical protein
MRKLLLLLCLLFAASAMDAQEKKYFYVDVWIFPKGMFLKTSCTALVDVSKNDSLAFRNLFKQDRTNVFGSETAALNEMGSGGWRLVSRGEDILYGITPLTHFIMEKEASSLEEALSAPLLIGGEEAQDLIKNMKSQKKEQKKEKAKERAKKRTDDMYY